MNSETTPKEVAEKTSPILAVFSALAVIVLLHALDALHLWAMALLVGLLMETASFLIIRWSVEKFMYRRVRMLSDAITKVKETDLDSKGNETSLDAQDEQKEIMLWANRQVQAIKSLKEKDNFRKDFIGNLSHELKTPLFNIQGFILTLLDSDLEDKELNRKFLAKAAKNVSRMTELLEDLDTITRLESASLDMQMEPTNVVELAKEVLDNSDELARKNDIQLIWDDSPSVLASPMVACSARQIKQVLTNFLSNSIHYGTQGGQTKLQLEDQPPFIKITIVDNGIGISDSDVSRIFERFYRADKSRSRNAGGSGLGLAIAKHILEAHGQDIHVQSELGQGTSFSFHLLKLDAEAPKKEPT